MRAGRKRPARFRLQDRGEAGSSVGVKHQNLRKFLWLGLVLSAGFAAWSWLRPYAWKEDPGAGCKVVGVQVTPDHSYFWVEAHLKMNPGVVHDLAKPVVLTTASGVEFQPADTTFGGSEATGTTELWLKFWLESGQMGGPLDLRINDGILSIKANEGIPAKATYFTSNNW